MSILLHNMYALISYATCEWPEMYSFKSVMFCSVLILSKWEAGSMGGGGGGGEEIQQSKEDAWSELRT